MERQRFRAWGVQGGKPGAAASAVFNPDTPDERDLAKIDVLYLKPNDVVQISSPGGGGFGCPYERSPEKVFEDVRNGFVSIEAAQKEYGVVIQDQVIDFAATEALRAELMRKTDLRQHDFGEERARYEDIWPQ